MKSKIGFHLDLMAHDGQIEKMFLAKPAIIKVISAMGLLNTLHDVLPNTIFIARDWNVGDDFLHFFDGDPVGSARRWFEAMRSSIQQAPWAYWESFNEPVLNYQQMLAYGKFEEERQHIMAQHGYRCCIGNFACGNPEIVGDGDLWPAFWLALRAAHQYHNILGLHEYSGLRMDTWFGPNDHNAIIEGRRQPFPVEAHEGWLFARYRKVWRKHIESRGWTNIRIALTEFGLDRVATITSEAAAGYATGPWTQCTEAWSRLDGRQDPAQYYVEQLQWADTQMQHDPYLVGATIFTWGTFSPVWASWDIQGEVADKLIAHISGGEVEPPRPPAPVRVRTIANVGQWVRIGAGTYYKRIASIFPKDVMTTSFEAEQVKRGSWVPVKLSNGTQGYALGTWLEVVRD